MDRIQQQENQNLPERQSVSDVESLFSHSEAISEQETRSDTSQIEQGIAGLDGIVSSVSEYVTSQQDIASEEVLELFTSWDDRIYSSVSELTDDLSSYMEKGFLDSDQRLNIIAQFAEFSEIVKEVRSSEEVVGESSARFFVGVTRDLHHAFEKLNIEGQDVASGEMKMEAMIYSLEKGNAAAIEAISQQVSVDEEVFQGLLDGASVYQNRIDGTIRKYPRTTLNLFRAALIGVMLIAAGCSSKGINIDSEVRRSMQIEQTVETGVSQVKEAVISKDNVPVEDKAEQELTDPPEHFTSGQKRLLLHEMESYGFVLEDRGITPEEVLVRFERDGMGFMESFNTMAYELAFEGYLDRSNTEMGGGEGEEDLERPNFSYERGEDFDSIAEDYTEMYEMFSNMTRDDSDPMRHAWTYFRLSGKGVSTPENLKENDTKSFERVQELVRRYRMSKSLQEAVNYLIHKNPEAGHAEMRVDGRLGRASYGFIRDFVSPLPWEFSRSPLFQYHVRSATEFRRAFFNQNPIRREDSEISPYLPTEFEGESFDNFINQFIDGAKVEEVSMVMKQPEGFNSPEIAQYEEELIESFEQTCGSKFFLKIMERGFQGDESKYFESEFFEAYRQQKTWYVNHFIELQQEYASTAKIKNSVERTEKQKDLVAKAKKLYITGYKVDFGFYKDTKYNYDGLGMYPKKGPQACGRYPYVINTMLGAPVKERIKGTGDSDDRRLPWQPPAPKQPRRYTEGKIDSQYIAKSDARKYFSSLEEGVYVVGRGNDHYGHMLMLGPEPGRAGTSNSVKDFLQTSSKVFFTDSFLKIGERSVIDGVNADFTIGQVTDDRNMEAMLKGSFADANDEFMILYERGVLQKDKVNLSEKGKKKIEAYEVRMASKKSSKKRTS